MGFPCGTAGKESACHAEDLGLIPGLGGSPGEGKGCPLQYSGLENSRDCIVHGVAKRWTQLSDFHYSLFINIDNIHVISMKYRYLLNICIQILNIKAIKNPCSDTYVCLLYFTRSLYHTSFLTLLSSPNSVAWRLFNISAHRYALFLQINILIEKNQQEIP